MAAAEAPLRNPLIYVLAVVLDTLVVGSLGAQTVAPPLAAATLRNPLLYDLFVVIHLTYEDVVKIFD